MPEGSSGAAAAIQIEHSADVDPSAELGAGTRIWHLAQVREGAVIGADCTIGRGAYVDHGVRVGTGCKIQNYALVYAPAVLGDGVFVGPAAVLTNDRNPRAVGPDGSPVDAAQWTASGIVLDRGASIGARSVVIAGVTIGAWSLVGAGATVTRDVPAHALVVGSPARQVGWVGRAGLRLQRTEDAQWLCPRTGEQYAKNDEGLTLR